MVNDIEKSIHRGEYALGAFLDISGAFSNLNLSTANDSMIRQGFTDDIRLWYNHYLRNRTATAELLGNSATRVLTKGTPQGGVLSPIAWNIDFDDLLNLFNQGPVHIKGFADDAALLVCGKDLFTLVHLMQTALDKALRWGLSRGLSFSAAKTVIVLFTHKRNPTRGLPNLD